MRFVTPFIMRFVTPSVLKARLEKWHIMFDPLSSAIENIVVKLKEQKLAREFWLKQTYHQVNPHLQYWYHIIEFPLIQKQKEFNWRSGSNITKLISSCLTNPLITHKDAYEWHDSLGRSHQFNLFKICSDELTKFHYHIVLVYELIDDEATITLHFTSRELQF